MNVPQVFAKLRRVKNSSGISDLQSLRDPEALLIDLRSSESFVQGFIPGSLNVPTIESFSLLGKQELAGKTRTYLIGESPDSLRPLIRKLGQMGFPPVASCLDLSILEAWRQEVSELASIEEIDSDTLTVRVAAWKTLVLDVGESTARRCKPYSDSIHIATPELSLSLSGLPLSTSLTVVCDGARPGSLAASILWNLGYKQISVVRRRSVPAHLSWMPLAS